MKREMRRYTMRYMTEPRSYANIAVPHTAVIREGSGDVEVEFWAEHGDRYPDRKLLLIGTGVPIPVQASWVATTPRSVAGHVLHLYEIHPPHALPSEHMARMIKDFEYPPPGKYGDIVAELRGVIEPTITLAEGKQLLREAREAIQEGLDNRE